MADVLVVGAGLAGARTCAELRAAGMTGRIELLGAELDPPYDRPPLSKSPGADSDLARTMGIDVTALADQVDLGVRGLALRVAGDRLEVDGSDGRVRTARVVVVATGARPVLPAAWALPGVHVLRTRRDAQGLWAAVGPGVRLAVIGGGWIGCEVAATAADRGARVQLLEAGGQVLADVDPGVAARVVGWLEERGVAVATGTPVAGVTVVGPAADPGPAARGGAGPRGAGPGLAVLPVDARPWSTQTADAVLAGLGAAPDTQWLAGSPVERTGAGALAVDGWGRSTVAGVLAVGDAAARWSTRASRRVTAGHWSEAMGAPPTIARVAVEWLADPVQGWDWAPATPLWDPVPYVFSDIAGRTLQVLGIAVGGDPVWREDAEGGWSCFTCRGEELLGVAAVGRPRDVAAVRRAIQRHPAGTPRVDRGALADTAAAPAAMFPGGG